MKQRIIAWILAVSMVFISIPVNAKETAKNTTEIGSSTETVSENKVTEAAMQTVSLNTAIETAVSSEVKTDTEKALKSFSQVTANDSAYDGRNYGMVTEVKQQSSFNCWIYACIAALESAVIRKGYANNSLDLSEMHFSYYCYPGVNGIKDPLGNISNDYAVATVTDGSAIAAANGIGGFVGETSRLFTNWIGPASEAKYNYFPNWGAGVTYPAESAFDSLYHVQGIREIPWGPDNEKDIKQMILDYGGAAVSVGITNGYRQCINGTNTLYNTSNRGTDHAVELVGWNDNYPKENFATTPPGNGAWLAKNSYGYVRSEDVIDQSCVEDGYIWISYYDNIYRHYSANAVAYDVEPADNYDNNYQYDGIIERGGLSGSYCFMEELGYECKPETTFMNVYTAKSGAAVEKIEAVSVCVEQKSPCRIKIYTNPVIVGRKMISYDRVSGETDFVARGGGVDTVKLKQPFYVAKGTKFAVCVITDKHTYIETTFARDKTLPISSDYKYTASFVDYMEAGQCYIGNGTDMTRLYDITVEDLTYETLINRGTPRIKAFTQNETIASATKVTISKGQLTMTKGQRTTVSAKSDSTALPGIYYHSSNPSVATVDAGGNIVAVGYGSCEIVAASEDSGAKAVCKVTVPQPVENGAKVGSSVTIKGNKYKVKSKTEVAYQSSKKNVKSASVPSTVTINKKTYKVTEISKNAFKGNKKLTKVTIGKNIKSIGASAFSGCKKLKTVTVKSTVLKKVGSKAFKGIYKKATFKVPKAKKKAYNKLLTKKSVGYVKSWKVK